MEKEVKKLRELRQELVNTLSGGLQFGKYSIRNSPEILKDMDVVIDELENLIDYGTEIIITELQHHKDTTIGLYATDKEPEKIFEEIFVHLIDKIGMDGEKTFGAMDYDYYNEFFKKGIKLLMWKIK